MPLVRARSTVQVCSWAHDFSMLNNHFKTWVEISRKNFKNNYNFFRKILGKKCLLMSVVKSNAYGHGIIDFSLMAQKAGVDWFGVDSVVEAAHLRGAGIKRPILVLGYTTENNFKTAAVKNISLSVSSFETLDGLRKYNYPPKVHIKIDTGMHRQGFVLEQVSEVVKFIKNYLPNLKVEGVFTHFSCVKQVPVQLVEFKKALEIFKKAGFNPIIHSASTATAVTFPRSHFDMVRIGAGLYGFLEIKGLKPVLSWKTIISEIKDIPKGAGIGYDLTEKLRRDSRSAVLPIGYWHGYPWSLSRVGKVLIRGKYAKILGRVSMDMMSVDITDIKRAKVGDEVILPLKDMVKWAKNSINYEIITRINPLIKRILTN